MSDRRDAVRDAVRNVLRRHGVHSHDLDRQTAAITADVLAAIDATGDQSPQPPALPTTPGALIFAAVDLPVEMLDDQALQLGVDGMWHSLPSWSASYAPDLINAEWVPARVVPDDDDGPVAVLRRVFELLDTSPVIEDPEIIAAGARAVISVCLERLGGEPGE